MRPISRNTSSTPARIWKGQGATGQKGTVIRETEYLDSRKNVKISSPIQFQLTIIPKSVFLAIKFNKRTAKLSEHNAATCLVTSLNLAFSKVADFKYL